MKNNTKTNVMNQAWKMYKSNLVSSFSEALKAAWEKIKSIVDFDSIPLGSKVVYSSMGSKECGTIIGTGVVKWNDNTTDEISKNESFSIVKYESNYAIGFQIIL